MKLLTHAADPQMLKVTLMQLLIHTADQGNIRSKTWLLQELPKFIL